MKGGKTDALIVPELEAMLGTYHPRNVPWTKAEDEILRRYYNRVPIDALMKHLPGRTVAAAKDRATRTMRGE
ncbi:MAG: SANT/Myb domain-containing protein [Actinomycetia bacterium]|nr:SANT/Myb domain-containing protein [Actinomycetes bacterium]